MTIQNVSSWNELNDYLFANTWDASKKRFRGSFAYRGVGDASYPLSTSLMRLGKMYPNLERNLLKQFQKYAQEGIVQNDTDWHWLSVAQHHGLPTRLLDWTHSPLVALHFATQNLERHKDKDAAVWKVNYAQVHDLLQNSQVASLRRLGARIFSVDALAETIKNLNDLDSLSAPNFSVAVFFEPPSIDDRIVNQFAYFSAISDNQMSFDTWLQLPLVTNRVDATKIIIPASLKWEIRDKLDQSNINERILVGGLDGLCSWLKRHYMPM
jgi:hypothetical protein